MVQKDLSHSFFVEPRPKPQEQPEQPEQPVSSSPVDPYRQPGGSIRPFTEADAPLPDHHTSPLRPIAYTVPSTPSVRIDPGANLPTNRAEGSLDAERSIFLQELSPDTGPVTGGTKILLVGSTFPMSPLFVRFGRNVTMAVLPA